MGVVQRFYSGLSCRRAGLKKQPGQELRKSEIFRDTPPGRGMAAVLGFRHKKQIGREMEFKRYIARKWIPGRNGPGKRRQQIRTGGLHASGQSGEIEDRAFGG